MFECLTGSGYVRCMRLLIQTFSVLSLFWLMLLSFALPLAAHFIRRSLYFPAFVAYTVSRFAFGSLLLGSSLVASLLAPGFPGLRYASARLFVSNFLTSHALIRL